MKIEKTGSKADTFVKLTLVFLIALLSFSIGTYVGKKYSDNQYKLAALEPSKKSEHESRAVASVGDEHGPAAKSEGEKSESLTDEEIKKLAEEFVADDSNAGDDGHGQKADGHREPAATNTKADAHGDAKTEKAETHGEAASAHGEAAHEEKAPAAKETAAHGGQDSTTKAAINVMEGKAAPAEKKAKNPSAIAETLPKDVAQYSVGKYTVQIASFPTEQEAKKRADELKQKGYSAFFIPAKIQGKGTYYRVSVGLFSTEKEAKEYRDEFKDKLKVSSAIIQKIAE